MDFCPLSMINKTQHIELSLSLHTDQRKFRAKMCANFLSLVQETLRELIRYIPRIAGRPTVKEIGNNFEFSLI